MTSVMVLLLVTASPASVPAIERLGDEVRVQLLRSAPEAPVAMVFDGAPAVLVRAVATVTAAKLANAKLAPMVMEVGGDVEARAVAQGARTLARVSISLEGQKLVARGDTYSVWSNFWSGRVVSRAAKAGVIVASLEADTDALTLAGAALPAVVAPSTLEIKASVLAKFAGAPAAIAAGDVDGDGRAEIVAVVNEEVMVFAADGRVMGRYDLSAGVAAALATRDSYAVVSVLGAPSRIVAWSAKRARAEVLSWSGAGLKNVGSAEVVPVDGVGVKFEPGFNRFSAEVMWGGRSVTLAVAPQAVATRGALTLVVTAEGNALLMRGPASGSSPRVSGVGCGSTLADLDGDGLMEVVLSGNRTSGDDELRVVSVSALESVAARGGTLAETSSAWQSPLARGRALAATAVDLDGVKGDEVIIATALADGTGELILLRREAP